MKELNKNQHSRIFKNYKAGYVPVDKKRIQTFYLQRNKFMKTM